MARMEPKAFDVIHALDEWRQVYPDRTERIEVLKRELRSCHGRPNYADRLGRKRPRAYPQTAKNIKRMLELLENGAIR